MSNRLTFSLASLILMFMFAFVAMPVMAHDNVDENDSHATAGHEHPTVTVTVMDADPTTDGDQVVDKAADTEGDDLNATIEFDVIITLPIGAQEGGGAVEAADIDPTALAYDRNSLPVGDGPSAGGVVMRGTPTQADAAANPRQWTVPFTLTIAGDPIDADITETAAQTAARTASRAKAIADAIADGLMIDITVPAGMIQTSALVRGPMVNQANLESVTTVTVIAMEVEVIEPVDVTGAASPSKVSGSTNTVVTITATGSGTLPALAGTDFSVTEAPTDATSTATMTPTVGDYANGMFTITPDATATEDSTITVSASTTGMEKITLADVTVEVDRTAPVVTITPPDGDGVAGQVVTATISVTGAADGEAVATEEISVKQIAANGAETVLPPSYIPGTGAVTFTPTAASTVTVTVAEGAVIDDVQNKSAEASEGINVIAAPVAATATASPSKVSGSTNTVVTITATGSGTLPALAGTDFSVTEAPTDATSTATMTPTVGDYANGMFTITPDATATEDSTITVSTSEEGAIKIALAADVTVNVDRTAPVVTITPPTADVKVGQAATVMIAVSGAADGEAIELGGISVTQTVTAADGTATETVLGHEYDAATGVTFTPDAESTVKVSVAVGAVVDDVGNGNEATSINISVGAADVPLPLGQPEAVTVARNEAQDGYIISWTDSDDDRVGGYYVEYNPTEFVAAGVGMLAIDTKPTSVAVWSTTDTEKAAEPPTAPSTAIVVPAEDLTDLPDLPIVVIPTLAAKGYLVVVPSNHNAAALPSGLTPHVEPTMPNLADFFRTGGTIDVVVTGGANHNVIITEIMVAEDLGKRGDIGTDRPEAGQWLELYNNTDAAINISDITITFATGYPAAAAPANATDRISNTVPPGWGFEAAFADALSGETTVNASGVRVVTKTFKSLRRKYKDDKRLQNDGTVIESGSKQGSWTLTADSSVFLAGRVGTPGSENRPNVFNPATFTAPTMSVTINEVANRSDDSNEWIELKGAKDTNLKLHKLNIVTAIGTETKIYHFPDADVKIPAGGLLLLTDQDPADNELAADLENGVPKPVRYRIETLAALPDDGNFLLVLRNKDNKILDVVGHHTDLSRNDPYTTLWPLSGNVGRISAKNKLAGGNVYKRARAIQGYSSNKDNGDEPAFEASGFSGIGYDRLVSAANKEHHGTPGYPNGAQINGDDAATQQVFISEIMYGDGSGNLPQWIELHNRSDVNGVDLHNWRIFIINHSQNADGSTFTGKILDEVWLRNVKLPPNQTALVVAHAGRHTTNLPSHRILNLRRDKPLLSSKGFSLRLEARSHEGDAAKRQAGDMIGNLAEADPNNRRADHQAFMDPAWELPAGIEDGARVSIARRGSAKVMSAGTDAYAWLSSSEDTRKYNAVPYYGRPSDIGTPGHTSGGVLPVSLSKFRPERLDDGSIVIRWITESETNNAGFNILRSEKRDGEFKQINTKLIAGQGTTSERTVYTHTDTSAKPNVVYYYQIQDVSLDGQVQTLRTTHLRGNVTAVGKATTTWGELKALQ